MAATASGGRLLKEANGSRRLQFPSNSFSSANLFIRFVPKDENRIKLISSAVVKAASFASAGNSAAVLSEDKQRLVDRTAGEGVMGVPALVADVAGAAFKVLKAKVRERKSWSSQIQMLIEKGILNCRFFTLLAVAGSLIGSVLCFVEGCFLVLESFFQYFHTMSQHLDQGGTMHLLIEAIDMFLMGAGMLNFGWGLYAMFVGSREIKRCTNMAITGSNLSGLHSQMVVPSSMEKQWVSHAKSKLGHAVVMILQTGTVEKFKNVPLTTGLDLACFAAAILVSSASVFLVSKLYSSTPAKWKVEEVLSAIR